METSKGIDEKIHNILEYWKQWEFLNFFDLGEVYKAEKDKSFIEKIDSREVKSEYHWNKPQNYKIFDYTLYLGIISEDLIAEELSTRLEEEFDSDIYKKRKLKETCVAQIKFQEECGYVKISFLGISTLPYGVTYCNQKSDSIMTPDFNKFKLYQRSLEKYLNEHVVKVLRKVKMEDFSLIYIKRLLINCLRTNHLSNVKDDNFDIWFPEFGSSKHIVVRKERKTNETFFNKLINSCFMTGRSQTGQSLVSVYKNILDQYSDPRLVNASKAEMLELLKPLKTKNEFHDRFSDLQTFMDEFIAYIFEIDDIRIINSFFLEDLQNLTEEEELSSLKCYLEAKNLKLDLFSEESKKNIQEVVRPKNTPLGRWPSSPKHKMSLMQQYAINQFCSNKIEREDSISNTLLAVNGPPGTGKTTLIREVIADKIVKRATKIAKLKKPSEGFTEDKVDCGSSTIFPLINELTGFEILIASSNNGAVENISKELPLLAQVDPLYREEMEFYKPVANFLLTRKKGKPNPPIEDIPQDQRMWGMFSAALGKSANVFNFIENSAENLNGDYFNNLPEDLQKIEKIRIQKGQQLNYWEYLKERPELSFEMAKKGFLKTKSEVESLISKYEKHVEILKPIHDFDIDLCTERIKSISTELSKLKSDLEKKNQEKKAIEEWLDRFQPSVFAEIINKLFKLSSVVRFNKRLEEYNQFNEAFIELVLKKEKLDNDLKNLKNQKKKYDKAKQLYNSLPEEIKETFVRPKIDNVQWQLTTPFQTEELNHLRNLLFISALKLQESFVRESKKFYSFLKSMRPILSNNTNVSSRAFQIGMEYLSFLLPVISSTFASVSRFFSKVPVNSARLGTLIIDEAGQSVAQSAAGAISRFKSFVVVGDPKQLEPIVVLPDNIRNKINKLFIQNHSYLNDYDPSLFSVQSIADRTNEIGAKLEDQRVGIPLRVHRRCAKPMFCISNELAYGGKMIFGSFSKPEKSSWVNVIGEAKIRQWVSEQGIAAIDILDNLLQVHRDIFVISPFREVVKNFKNDVRRSNIFRKHGLTNDWLGRIGTIHTFQGKEARSVIVLLGCDEKTRSSAQAIVKERPNLLNVAVTRAKSQIYIVGDKSIWSEIFGFDVALKYLTNYPRILHL